MEQIRSERRGEAAGRPSDFECLARLRQLCRETDAAVTQSMLALNGSSAAIRLLDRLAGACWGAEARDRRETPQSRLALATDRAFTLNAGRPDEGAAAGGRDDDLFGVAPQASRRLVSHEA